MFPMPSIAAALLASCTIGSALILVLSAERSRPSLDKQQDYGGVGEEELNRYKRARDRIVCLNGTEVNGACLCRAGYVGVHCERLMNCRSFERLKNGSCTHGCKEHWLGERCDVLDCEHGEEDEYEQRCVCERPYTGEFCEELLTKNVYLHYNTKVATIGPLGAIILIPMMVVYHICEVYARKRQVRRIGKTWGDKSNLNSVRIKHLLKAES